MSWTGRGEAELVDTIPVTSRAGEKPVVVMSLGAGRDADTTLPDLHPGDRLEIGAELEVTTDLTLAQARQPGVKPVGVPYEYAPAVVGQLLLARGAAITEAKRGEAIPIGKAKRMKLSHDQHHGVFVFDGAADRALVEVEQAGLPWSGTTHVNFVLSAHHDDADDGHLLLIGQNEPDGTVEGDMGAICAIRARPAKQRAPEANVEKECLVADLPLQGDVKRVVYSVPLGKPKKNEQIRVRADLDASSKEIGYAARLKSRIFLADSPGQLEPDGNAHACEVGSEKGQITKGNGFNCLPDAASVSFAKVGVLRIVKDAERPLYLNLVAVAGDPEKKGRDDRVKLLPSCRLTIVRYPPEACG